MTSPIRFEAPKVASGEEVKNFSRLTAIAWDRDEPILIQVDGYLDVDKDGKDECLFCAGQQPHKSTGTGYRGRPLPDTGDLSCGFQRVKPDGKTEEDFEWASDGFDLVKRVEDFRYGDIDGDGDTDVAFKMTDGAIYVYHNVTSLPPPPKKAG
ncbi:MAG: hypothetical protein HY465_00250 [Deltaproteobacteria bacterium]|nr:hypothetical protein [Deltaproteobacteria bacterium]